MNRCFICLEVLPEVHGWMTPKRGAEAFPCCPMVSEGGGYSPRCEWKKVFDPETRAKYEEEKRKSREIQLKVLAKNEGKEEGYYLDSFEVFMEKFRGRHPAGFGGAGAGVSEARKPVSGPTNARLKEPVQNVEEVDWKLKASEGDWDSVEDPGIEEKEL